MECGVICFFRRRGGVWAARKRWGGSREEGGGGWGGWGVGREGGREGEGEGREKGKETATFSNSFPKLSETIPFALFSSGAPGSPIVTEGQFDRRLGQNVQG